MARILLALVVLVLAGLIGGAAFLGTRDLPPPLERVEKPIPNDRFPR